MHAALCLFLAVSMISVQPGATLTWIADGAAVLPQQGPDSYEATISQLAAQANLSTDPVRRFAPEHNWPACWLAKMTFNRMHCRFSWQSAAAGCRCAVLPQPQCH